MLKKLLQRGILLPLALVMAMGLFGSAEAYQNPLKTVKIGLYYGSGALQAANLQTRVGAGYEFGYFDSSREFVSLAYINAEKLTMLKDKNMYLTWSSTYTDTKPDSFAGTVGCYHILLDKLPGSYTEAQIMAASFEGAFPAYYNGQWRVCVGSYSSYDEAEADRSARQFIGQAYSASNKCIVVVTTGTTDILFEYDCGTSSSFAVRPCGTTDGSGNTAKAQTWFKGKSFYGAFQYSRASGDNITVINYVDMEDYVKGVLPWEVSPEWPVESQKAMAVAIRSFATYSASSGKHSSNGFDLCSTTDCQYYGGTDRATSLSDSAVDATAGQYLLYNGSVCDALYFSSDGGATENSENVFYSALPYLRGVTDPYESGVSTGYSSWSYTYTADNITWILQNKGYSISDIASITPTYTDIGNIYSLKFTDVNGKSITFSKSQAGSILYSSTLGKYTHSQRFTVKGSNNGGEQLYVNGASAPVEDPGALYAVGSGGVVQPLGSVSQISVISSSGQSTVNVSGSGVVQTGSSYVISGSGWGHNVGMSQYGAYGMAKKGFTYDEILKFYYTGVTIG